MLRKMISAQTIWVWSPQRKYSAISRRQKCGPRTERDSWATAGVKMLALPLSSFPFIFQHCFLDGLKALIEPMKNVLSPTKTCGCSLECMWLMRVSVLFYPLMLGLLHACLWPLFTALGCWLEGAGEIQPSSGHRSTCPWRHPSGLAVFQPWECLPAPCRWSFVLKVKSLWKLNSMWSV